MAWPNHAKRISRESSDDPPIFAKLTPLVAYFPDAVTQFIAFPDTIELSIAITLFLRVNIYKKNWIGADM